MKILITGIAGFVGLSLCEELINLNKFKILGIDNFSYGDKSNLKKIKNNIEFLNKQLEKALKDIEKLKDKQREFANGNGH